MEHKLDISDFSTRELKNALRSAHAYGYDYDYYTGEETPRQIWVGQRHLPGGQLTGFFATVSQIRAALASRPHIPSKKEGKTLRRLMSKTGMTADELRAHPRYGQEIVDTQWPNRRVITAQQARRLEPHMGRKHIGKMFKIKG